ncbi:MAG: hypothetical protein LBH81_02100 [Rickettsiales bacterium]|jgi:hypothetical protein|nr:hypothetical protein [Rickettsiales bacterium]
MGTRGISLFSALAAFAVLFGPAQAYTPKKADVVATKEAPSAMSAGSLASTALALGLGAMNINQQFKALSASCVPSQTDINFVQRMVLEVAKTGVNAKDFTSALGDECDYDGAFRENAIGRANNTIKTRCFEPIKNASSDSRNVNGIIVCSVASAGNNCESTLEGAVLVGFPKVSSEQIKKSTGETVYASNIHDIFAAVMGHFGPDDLLESEIASAQRLTALADQCSEVRLAAKQKEVWMGFAQEAIMGVSAGTLQANPMDALQAAGGMVGGGGMGSLIQAGSMLMMR